jgi:hypothetical protein
MVEMEVKRDSKTHTDSRLAQLLEEGRKSKLSSPAEAKKELKKRGINILN